MMIKLRYRNVLRLYEINVNKCFVHLLVKHYRNLHSARNTLYQNIRVHYENKTSKCKGKYANLLHYRRRKHPTCFGHVLWPSSGRCFSKDVLQRTSKPIYKYKILSFKYNVLKYLALNMKLKIYVKIYNTDNINCAKLREWGGFICGVYRITVHVVWCCSVCQPHSTDTCKGLRRL